MYDPEKFRGRLDGEKSVICKCNKAWRIGHQGPSDMFGVTHNYDEIARRFDVAHYYDEGEFKQHITNVLVCSCGRVLAINAMDYIDYCEGVENNYSTGRHTPITEVAI